MRRMDQQPHQLLSPARFSSRPSNSSKSLQKPRAQLQQQHHQEQHQTHPAKPSPARPTHETPQTRTRAPPGPQTSPAGPTCKHLQADVRAPGQRPRPAEPTHEPCQGPIYEIIGACARAPPGPHTSPAGRNVSRRTLPAKPTGKACMTAPSATPHHAPTPVIPSHRTLSRPQARTKKHQPRGGLHTKTSRAHA